MTTSIIEMSRIDKTKHQIIDEKRKKVVKPIGFMEEVMAQLNKNKKICLLLRIRNYS